MAIEETVEKRRLVLVLGERGAVSSNYFEAVQTLKREDGSDAAPPRPVQIPLSEAEVATYLDQAMTSQSANIDELTRRMAQQAEEHAAAVKTLTTEHAAAVKTLTTEHAAALAAANVRNSDLQTALSSASQAITTAQARLAAVGQLGRQFSAALAQVLPPPEAQVQAAAAEKA
jgi:23S rRNA maturation-related 3'-5' exoribonuclease YhaM